MQRPAWPACGHRAEGGLPPKGDRRRAEYGAGKATVEPKEAGHERETLTPSGRGSREAGYWPVQDLRADCGGRVARRPGGTLRPRTRCRSAPLGRGPVPERDVSLRTRV